MAVMLAGCSYRPVRHGDAAAADHSERGGHERKRHQNSGDKPDAHQAELMCGGGACKGQA